MNVSLNAEKPYEVPENIEFVHLVVTGTNDPVPTAVSAFTHRAPVRIGLRLAGGCSNMSAADKQGMLRFFGDGLHRFTGLVSSGGTRSVDAWGYLDPMVTDVPALLAAQSPKGVVAISTAPRTDGLGLVDNSRLVLSEDGVFLPNPGVHMLVLVQSNNGVPLDWDGDLAMYFSLFGNLVRHGDWRFGMVAYNGGGVTRSEVLHAMAMNWPVILVQGSGRQTDQIIGELHDQSLELPGGVAITWSSISVVQNGDSDALHEACVRHGLIA